MAAKYIKSTDIQVFPAINRSDSISKRTTEENLTKFSKISGNKENLSQAFQDPDAPTYVIFNINGYWFRCLKSKITDLDTANLNAYIKLMLVEGIGYVLSAADGSSSTDPLDVETAGNEYFKGLAFDTISIPNNTAGVLYYGLKITDTNKNLLPQNLKLDASEVRNVAGTNKSIKEEFATDKLNVSGETSIGDIQHAIITINPDDEQIIIQGTTELQLNSPSIIINGGIEIPSESDPLSISAGVSISKKLTVSDNSNKSGADIYGPTTIYNGTTPNFTLTPGTSIVATLPISTSSLAESSSTDSGSIITAGGVGIGKNLNVGGTATIYSTIDSTTKDTGSLVVEGGVGIEKNLSVGGNINMTNFQVENSTGNITAEGNLNVGGGVGIADDLGVWGTNGVVSNAISTKRLYIKSDLESESYNLSISSNGNISSTGSIILQDSANFKMYDGRPSGNSVFEVVGDNGNTHIQGILNVYSDAFLSGKLNNITITRVANGATLTITDGKTLTANNTLTLTGTDASSVAFGTGGTVAYKGSKLNQFAETTSAELAGIVKSGGVSDVTGTGKLVFESSPILKTPNIGVATATSVNGLTLTALSSGFSVTGGETSKTLTISDSTTLAANAITLGSGKTLTLGSNLTTTGAYNTTFAQVGNITLTLPATDQTLATIAGPETLTNKTLTSPKISGGSFKYNIINSSLLADRNITLPLLTANDEFVFKDHIQALTGKTVNGATISATYINLASGKSLTAQYAGLTLGADGKTGNITLQSNDTNARTVTLTGNPIIGSLTLAPTASGFDISGGTTPKSLSVKDTTIINKALTIGADTTYTGSVTIKSAGSSPTAITGPNNGEAKLITGTYTDSAVISNSTTDTENYLVRRNGNGYVYAKAFYATSDERLKENITDYKYHDSILDISVKEFDYKKTGSHSFGFIAQELQEKFPEIVNKGEDGYLSIAESKLVYLLLEEVKLLKEEVKLLRGN